MRLRIIISALFFPLILTANSFKDQAQLEQMVAQAEICYQSGDQFLAAAKIDSALGEYLQARKSINEAFFLLIRAKKEDSLSTEIVTRHWDRILSKMQTPLDTLTDCKFERCVIYREEKAANWCIQVFENGSKDRIQVVVAKLVYLLKSDARAQLNNFFSKIYMYLKLQKSLKVIHEIVLPGSSEVDVFDKIFHRFFQAYFENRPQDN